MKEIYILLIFGILTSCSHKENNKKTTGSIPIIEKMGSIFIDFERIYTNQQEKGQELGPWWIFYETIIHNNEDSLLHINPKSDSIPKVLLKEWTQIKDRAFLREKILSYNNSLTPSGPGDVFILFRTDTIPLYCKHSPIVLNGHSQERYLFYNNWEDVENLYHNNYEIEYKEFQHFLSDIVQKSTVVFIFNYENTCFLSPINKLIFSGDPNVQAEWSFW